MITGGFQSWQGHSQPNLDHLKEGLVHYNSLRTEELYLYTQHEVFYEEGVIKQTRSGPNWEGGVVTLTTCKHHMRRTQRKWEGTWIAGLGPKECEYNTLIFCGRVHMSFGGNYELGKYLQAAHPAAHLMKRASNNPRGDIYTPRKTLVGNARYDHRNFIEPFGHTRSTEFYKKSPGSISEREDGLIPKWWRDIEYMDNRGVRPVSLILAPCYLFSKPTAWTRYKPGRASLRLTVDEFASSLLDRPLCP